MSGGMPHTPSGGGCIAPPMSPCPSVRMSMNAFRSKASASARRISGLSKGGTSRLMIRLALAFAGTSSQIACGAWLLTSRNRGTVTSNGKVMSNWPALPRRHRIYRRPVRRHGIFDAVEVRPAALPVIRIARHLDMLIRLELDEFERAGADRMLAHLPWRHVAGVDWRVSRGEQRDDRRLWPFQTEGRSKIAIGGDLVEVLVPGLAGIRAQLLLRLAEQQVPGAFDVIGGKGLAVVPFDALAQPECQFGAVLVPRPIGGQIRDDRLQAVLRHVLLIQDKIVEDAHHRDLGRIGRLFEDRHAGRTVPVSVRRPTFGQEPAQPPKWC